VHLAVLNGCSWLSRFYVASYKWELRNKEGFDILHLAVVKNHLEYKNIIPIPLNLNYAMIYAPFA